MPGVPDRPCSSVLCCVQYHATDIAAASTNLKEFGVIKDPMLKKRVAEALGVRVEDLTADLLLPLDSLDASELDITTVAGLEHCCNLTVLSLQDNRISDISPLATLKYLEVLSLNGNPIADLSTVRALTELRELYFGQTKVADISFVSALPNLELISFPLSRVTSLVDLYFSYFLTKATPRLQKVFAHNNDLGPGSIAFVAALQQAGLEVWSGGRPKQGIAPRG
jgi:hypothetical protein